MCYTDEWTMGNECFRALVSPEVAAAVFAQIEAQYKREPVNMADLIQRVYQEAQGREFVTSLGLAYILDPKDTGSPTPDEIDKALDSLVALGLVVKTTSGVFAQYRARAGAPRLAVA